MEVGVLFDKNTLVVIPARYNSSRLPGKVLKTIHGKPMIYWTYSAAVRAKVGDVIVATDSDLVISELRKFEIPYILTSSKHQNGTERVFEVSGKKREYGQFINIQGDEPLLNIESVRAVAASGFEKNVFKTAISSINVGTNPSEIKVALSKGNKICYASRAPIPHDLTNNHKYWKIHGIYAYERQTLRKFVSVSPGPLERLESVEQLRCIEADIPLAGVITPHTERSVDTAEDLEYMRSLPPSVFVDFNSIE